MLRRNPNILRQNLKIPRRILKIPRQIFSVFPQYPFIPWQDIPILRQNWRNLQKK